MCGLGHQNAAWTGFCYLDAAGCTSVMTTLCSLFLYLLFSFCSFYVETQSGWGIMCASVYVEFIITKHSFKLQNSGCIPIFIWIYIRWITLYFGKCAVCNMYWYFAIVSYSLGVYHTQNLRYHLCVKRCSTPLKNHSITFIISTSEENLLNSLHHLAFWWK